MKAAISVRGLGKRFSISANRGADSFREVIMNLFARNTSSEDERPDRFWALRDLTFDVAPGEVVGVIGRNGAGKSTLLKILSRITAPTAGEAVIRGRVASLLEVGTGFHGELSGRENIFLNGTILGMTRREIQQKLDEIVAFAEIEQFLDVPVKRYSSGMSVRLAFAIAAHLDNDILIVDEVLAVGDAAFQLKCMDRMRGEVERGKTLVVVSHDAQSVRRICQRGLYLKAGALEFDGPVGRALELYQGALEVARRPAPQREIQHRPGEARFMDWHVERNGTRGHDVTSGDSATLTFRLDSDREIADAYVALSVWSDRKELVIGASSYDSMNRFVAIGVGSYDVRFELALPLQPGHYQVDVHLNSKAEGKIDRWASETPLEVRSRPGALTTLHVEWRGLLDIPARADIVRADAPNG